MIALYINGNLADLKQDAGISISISQKSVTDTGSVRGAFSYTVKLPNTPNNARIFASIYDLDVDITDVGSAYVTPNVYGNALLIEDGRLQLVCLTRLLSFGPDGYEIQIIAQNNGWANKLKDTKLQDVDRSFVAGQWRYERWQAKYGICDWKDKALNAGNLDPAYFIAENGDFKAHAYPLIDLGGNSVLNTDNRIVISISQQRPAVFIKHLLTAHFQQIGYRLDYSAFERLVIPTNQDKWKAVFDEAIDFFAEIVQDYIDQKFSNRAPGLKSTYLPAPNFAFGLNAFGELSNASAIQDTFTVGDDSNGCTTTPNADIEVVKYITNTTVQPMAIEVEFNLRLVASHSGETYYRGPGCTDPFTGVRGFVFESLWIRIEYADLSADVFEISDVNKVFNQPVYLASQFSPDQTISGKAVIQPTKTGIYKIYYGFNAQPFYSNAFIETEMCDTLKIGSYIRFRGIAGEVLEGSYFDLRAALPDITVGKIIQALNRMFNLYWFTDEDSKLVIPRPFDTHFIAPVKDLSVHVNRANPPKMGAYNEKFERFRTFLYSEDSNDTLLQAYKDREAKEFGTYEWENNNLTKLDSKDETVEFSPTICIETTNVNFVGYFIPTMWADSAGADYNRKPRLRILYYRNVATDNYPTVDLVAPDTQPTVRVNYAVQDADCGETASYYDSLILPLAWFQVNGRLVDSLTMAEAFEAVSLKFDDGKNDSDGYGDGLFTRYYSSEDVYIRRGKTIEFELNTKMIELIELFDLRRLWVMDKHIIQITDITGYKPGGNSLVGIKAIVRI